MQAVTISILALLLGASSSNTTLTQQPNKYEVAGIHDAAAAETFFLDLQEAVAKDDRGKVAAMIHYPITVQIAGLKVKLQRSPDLLLS
jgi:4-hydroxy-L-threonine phosphate dehydrogenase PdxA